MSHQVVCVFRIDASCSAAAEDKVREWISDMGLVATRALTRAGSTDDWPEGFDGIDMLTEADIALDRTNQRIVYLPPEDNDENSGDDGRLVKR